VPNPLRHGFATCFGVAAGYIKLREFNALAGRDVAAAVTELTAKGADRFVLDLRDNPGGLVQVCERERERERERTWWVCCTTRQYRLEGLRGR
jgi:hypothetical protein